MSRMCIDVEFLAGTDIIEAVEEAKQKARQWNVAYVKFDFNGCSISVGQEACVQRVAARYQNDPQIKYIVENG